MKKLLTVILAAALLLSMFCVPAYAAEGDAPEPTSGPWDGFWWMTGGPMICFDADGGEEHMIYYRQGMTAQSPIITDNEALPGATYDKETNTLTIDNVKLPDDELTVHFMGDDFKLRVVGECELGHIWVRNYLGYHSTSLSIIGDGTLTVNEKRDKEAMYFYGDGNSLMHFDIADSVTVHLYAGENASDQAPQHVMRIWSTYADPAVTAGGRAIPEAKSKFNTSVITEQVNAVWVDNTDTESNHGKRVKSKTDPDGIYAVTDLEYYGENGIEDRYGITKYYLDPTFNIYMPDPAYRNQYGDQSVVLTKEEFEAGYEYILEPLPKKILFTSDFREKNRGYRGVRFANDGEPDSVYIGTMYWLTPYQNKLSDNISNYYLYGAHWDEDEQLYIRDNNSIESGSAEDLEAKGYRIATEDVEKRASMKCWVKGAPYDDTNRQESYDLVTRKSDPDGLYAYMGTYTDRPSRDESGVVINPVVYDEENDEYYLRGYYGGTVGTDIFHVTDEDWASEDCDFAYKTETVEQRAEVQYIKSGYSYTDYSTEAILMTKDGEPGQLYGAELWKWADGHKEYVLNPIEWRESKGLYYQNGDTVRSDDFDSIEALEAAGYHPVLEEQPVEFITFGEVRLNKGMTLYKDDSDNSYFTAWHKSQNTAFSISESEKYTYGDTEYYIGTATEVDPQTLHNLQHEEPRSDSMWWIEGTEYHHEASAAEVHLLGDVNGDGNVDISDVTMIQQYAAEIPLQNPGLVRLCGDVNNDGNVDINDATEVQKYIADYDIPYPIGEPV